MSEHHRVEFSALAPFLEEMDPNSLHQVAIAVPGNYVRKRKYHTIELCVPILVNDYTTQLSVPKLFNGQ